MHFVLNWANVQPPKASLDAMNIIKLALGIYREVLVKRYAVLKIRINE